VPEAPAESPEAPPREGVPEAPAESPEAPPKEEVPEAPTEPPEATSTREVPVAPSDSEAAYMFAHLVSVRYNGTGTEEQHKTSMDEENTFEPTAIQSPNT